MEDWMDGWIKIDETNRWMVGWIEKNRWMVEWI